MDKTSEIVSVPGWPRPSGYANGVVTTGRTLYVAGQIGWEAEGSAYVFKEKGFVGQFDRALANVVAVIEAAGGKPEHLVKMTVYVTDLDAYRQNLAGVGEAWRRRLGKVFPAMALLGVAGLVEREALVEIEAIASLP